MQEPLTLEHFPASEAISPLSSIAQVTPQHSQTILKTRSYHRRVRSIDGQLWPYIAVNAKVRTWYADGSTSFRWSPIGAYTLHGCGFDVH